MLSVQNALNRHASDFIDVYIFGSVLSGKTDEFSDVDLLIVRRTELPFFDRIREIMGLRREFGNLDLLIYTPEELNDMLSEPGRNIVKSIVEVGYKIEGTQNRGRALVESSRK